MQRCFSLKRWKLIILGSKQVTTAQSWGEKCKPSLTGQQTVSEDSAVLSIPGHVIRRIWNNLQLQSLNESISSRQLAEHYLGWMRAETTKMHFTSSNIRRNKKFSFKLFGITENMASISVSLMSSSEDRAQKQKSMASFLLTNATLSTVSMSGIRAQLEVPWGPSGLGETGPEAHSWGGSLKTGSLVRGVRRPAITQQDNSLFSKQWYKLLSVIWVQVEGELGGKC